MASRGQEVQGNREWLLIGGVSFWANENNLKLIVVIVAQIYDMVKATQLYNLNEWIV